MIELKWSAGSLILLAQFTTLAIFLWTPLPVIFVLEEVGGGSDAFV